MMPTDRKLKFAIFGNVYQAKKSASIQKILSILNERGANIIFDREFFDFLVNNQRLNVKADGVFENDDFDADIVISMLETAIALVFFAPLSSTSPAPSGSTTKVTVITACVLRMPAKAIAVVHVSSTAIKIVNCLFISFFVSNYLGLLL